VVSCGACAGATRNISERERRNKEIRFIIMKISEAGETVACDCRICNASMRMWFFASLKRVPQHSDKSDARVQHGFSRATARVKWRL
jgi:hypothetical protein